MNERDMLIFQQSNDWTDRLMYTRFSLQTALIAFNTIILTFFSFFGIEDVYSKPFIISIFCSSLLSTFFLIWNLITLKIIYLGLAKFFYNAYNKAQKDDYDDKVKDKMDTANEKNATIECREFISFIFLFIEVVLVIIFVWTIRINV